MKLEVGMCVRTTYGIGKITDMYIIYSDDEAFWHIACITDKYILNEGYIEVGLYAEEETYGPNGDFLRITNKSRTKKLPLYEKYETSEHKEEVDNYLKERGIEYVCYINHDKGKPRGCSSLYDDHKFIKASHNIIDLIEENDLIQYRINGDLYVSEVKGHPLFNEYILHIEFGNTIIDLEDLQIISIVTKEVFSSVEYRVETN